MLSRLPDFSQFNFFVQEIERLFFLLIAVAYTGERRVDGQGWTPVQVPALSPCGAGARMHGRSVRGGVLCHLPTGWYCSVHDMEPCADEPSRVQFSGMDNIMWSIDTRIRAISCTQVQRGTFLGNLL